MKEFKKGILFLIITTLATFVISACAGVSLSKAHSAYPNSSVVSTKKRMRAFRSDEEIKSYLHELAEKMQRQRGRQAGEPQGTPSETANTAVAQTAPAMGAVANKAGTASKDEESVTNVQHAGVDEGDIVKLHGNQLVILRRGRLFTVAIGDNSLKPISSTNAFGPEIDPTNTWYDEMLVSDDTIVVIGYSYERGGTEVGLFNIDDAGYLRYRSTYHLRSNDYYSSRNYASRLIGSKLIFYTPLYLSPWDENPFNSFPAVRRWHRGAKESEFQRIASATRIYKPEHSVTGASGLALHTVTVCDLSQGELNCQATGVVGPPGRVFYVSPDSVYVWTSDWTWEDNKQRAESMLYRMPLDGSSPTALQVSGSPVDQFSFLESEDKHLNVLVRSGAAGDGMWAAEVAAGDVALMRVPLDSFSDGSEAVPASQYQQLPKPEGYTFENRFVGDYLLYGTGSGWGEPEQGKKSSLYAVRWTDGELSELKLAHGIDRIEVLGRGALVVGTDGENLHFTGIQLGGRPSVAHTYTRKDASQGELRSHGFFYKPDGPDTGTLGLPISVPGRPGYQHLFTDSASILFLRNQSLDLHELGELDSHPERAENDNCRASCVDWYGNARPLFVRGRVFALLGYELVEGRLDDGKIREVRRISYAPRRLSVTRREE